MRGRVRPESPFHDVNRFPWNVLQHDLIQRQIGHQALRLRILFLQLLQLSCLPWLKLSIDVLPSVERPFRNSDIRDELGHQRP